MANANRSPLEIAETFLTTAYVLKHAAVGGPVVFIERVDRHRLATGWVELPVTGVLEAHEGRITLWRDYFDLATLASAWPAPQA